MCRTVNSLALYGVHTKTALKVLNHLGLCKNSLRDMSERGWQFWDDSRELRRTKRHKIKYNLCIILNQWNRKTEKKLKILRYLQILTVAYLPHI